MEHYYWGSTITINSKDGKHHVRVEYKDEYYSSTQTTTVGVMLYVHKMLLGMGVNGFSPIRVLEFVEQVYDRLEMKLKEEQL